MNRAAGKTAIVTGAGSGIGAETARHLAREGARVVLADIALANAQKVAAEINTTIGEAATAVALDVTSEEQWTRVMAESETAHGPTNVLVNCAGVASSSPIGSLTETEFRRVTDINQLGTFLGIKSAIGPMRRAGGGSIVNVSSLAGLVGMPKSLAYCASKWAVRGITKSAAVDLGPDRIRVNSVHPGVIDTPILGEVREIVDQILPPGLPLGRIGRAEEVASLILFLACDESSYCTGSEFAVDGGWHAS